MGRRALILRVFLCPSLRGGTTSARTPPGRFASLNTFKSYYQRVSVLTWFEGLMLCFRRLSAAAGRDVLGGPERF